VNRLELQTKTLRALADSPSAPVYWAPSEIQGYVQEALEVMAEEVGFTKRTFTVPRRAGVSVYQLSGISTSIIAPYRLWLPDYQRRLESRTLHDLDGRFVYWMESVNIPECWVSLSWDSFLVCFHETTGTGTLEVNCYCWPDALDDDMDIPELLPTSHEALTIYAAGMGYLKSWDGQETVTRWKQFFSRYGHEKSKVSINRVQSRFWAREESRE
jgi:hypothetical protein